jgi:hypothetical protein
MSIAEFFNYLITREPTCELGLQLAAVYEDRVARRAVVMIRR